MKHDRYSGNFLIRNKSLLLVIATLFSAPALSEVGLNDDTCNSGFLTGQPEDLVFGIFQQVVSKKAIKEARRKKRRKDKKKKSRDKKHNSTNSYRKDLERQSQYSIPKNKWITTIDEVTLGAYKLVLRTIIYKTPNSLHVNGIKITFDQEHRKKILPPRILVYSETNLKKPILMINSNIDVSHILVEDLERMSLHASIADNHKILFNLKLDDQTLWNDQYQP